MGQRLGPNFRRGRLLSAEHLPSEDGAIDCALVTYSEVELGWQWNLKKENMFARGANAISEMLDDGQQLIIGVQVIGHAESTRVDYSCSAARP